MDDRKTIDVAVVRQLIRSQFPAWAGLRIEPVREAGWDHCTFRLGDEMSVRLPSAARYVAQVEKEQRFLPLLAPRLPLPVPVPLALGRPSPDYPWPWSVLCWIDGAAATPERSGNLEIFAAELAHFLRALHAIDATNAPAPGAHNFFRGGDLAVYDQETRAAIHELAAHLDVQQTVALWELALASTWHAAPVWIHGDVAPGNLLVRDGRLCGVIDFGACGAGDPACDLVIAWTLLSGASRAVFCRAMSFDRATWQRARGWALWKALITWAAHPHQPHTADCARMLIATLLAGGAEDVPQLGSAR
ncbi:MAG TPA: aminoglycoside phosphotransferase family protein [Polyangiaceae bacterium]|nr:aminoglycoside phosphotransferase family protein [Polyangiaceae bacterium]